MHGHSYDLRSDHNSDQYINTTKELQLLVGRTNKKYTADLVRSIETLTLDTPTQPPPPADATDRVASILWRKELDTFCEKTQIYADFKAYVYNVVFGQCTDALQNRLRSHARFTDAQQDGLALLAIIKTVTYNFEEGRDVADALCDVKEKFYSFKQGPHTSLQRHYEAFDRLRAVMDEVGVDIVDPTLLKSVADNKGNDPPTDDDHLEAKKISLATRFIRSTNAKYATYLTELRHAQLNGRNECTPRRSATRTTSCSVVRRTRHPPSIMRVSPFLRWPARTE